MIAARTHCAIGLTACSMAGMLLLAACSGNSSDSSGAAVTIGPGRATQTASREGDADRIATVSASVSGVNEPPEPPHAPPLPPPRDADHRFLRRMLNHHEAILAIVHEQMMSPKGHEEHGSAVDPVAFDSQLDAEKNEMIGLLSRLYGESYSARLPHDLPKASSLPAEALQQRLIAAFKAGAAMVDSAGPTLGRTEIRRLAARIRSTELQRLRKVEAALAAPKMETK